MTFDKFMSTSWPFIVIIDTVDENATVVTELTVVTIVTIVNIGNKVVARTVVKILKKNNMLTNLN